MLVFPGSFLSTEEEFLAGKNCFQGENGDIYSDCVGIEQFDAEEKVVNVVKKTRDIHYLEVGHVVFGMVSLVKEQSVMVDILDAFDPKDPSKKIVFGSPLAMLPVFSVSQRYVKSLDDFFKVGDIVKARVDSIASAGIDLETKSAPSLGVVIAFCSNCRQQLKNFERTLKCSNCAAIESRHLSFDYLVK